MISVSILGLSHSYWPSYCLADSSGCPSPRPLVPRIPFSDIIGLFVSCWSLYLFLSEYLSLSLWVSYYLCIFQVSPILTIRLFVSLPILTVRLSVSQTLSLIISASCLYLRHSLCFVSEPLSLLAEVYCLPDSFLQLSVSQTLSLSASASCLLASVSPNISASCLCLRHSLCFVSQPLSLLV